MKRKIIITIFLLSILVIFLFNYGNSYDEYYFYTNVNKNSNNYDIAQSILNKLNLDEKIRQTIITEYSSENIKKEYGGYIFFEHDFKGKSENDVINMINDIQKDKKIKCITAVDEEGGDVIRISSNKKLSTHKFKSSQELYNDGGFDRIIKDVYEKSYLLEKLGINLNLAPVVDVSTNNNDYMYKRSFGKDEIQTGIYAKEVIEASLNTKVTYTLKHFPGYGNNIDTHKNVSIDNRSLEEIMNKDIIPFKEGIISGAKMIMVSHNIVTSIDSNNPASLSYEIHKLLKNDLKYNNLIITDDLSMYALYNISNKCEKAILAMNDLIITKDSNICELEIKNAINNGNIKKELLDNIVLRILTYKLENNLIM